MELRVSSVFNPWLNYSAFSTKSFAPVAGTPFGVHDSDNPHAIRLFQINHRVRKLAGQGALRRRTETQERSGLAADFADEPFDFVVKAAAKFRKNVGVIFDGAGIFFTRIGMKDVRLHRLRIFWMRTETSSAGMPLTLPDSISSMRRFTSVFQAASISGSLPCKSSVRRPTSSPTLSGGQCLVSSTISSSVIGMK